VFGGRGWIGSWTEEGVWGLRWGKGWWEEDVGLTIDDCLH